MAEIKHINVFGEQHDLGGGGGSGQAVVNITRNGTTFTATREDGTTFTFTQQDMNTWQKNTKTQNGYVTAGEGNIHAVWGTGDDETPKWMSIMDYLVRNNLNVPGIVDGTNSEMVNWVWGTDETGYPLWRKPIGADRYHPGVVMDTSAAHEGYVLKVGADYTPEWKPENDTWQQNTDTQEGYVLAGQNNPDAVWGTDENGNPSWRGAVEVEQNSDMNDYVEHGTYWASGDEDLPTLTNAPFATDSYSGFNMTVGLVGGTLTQIATSYKGEVKIRHYEHWASPPKWTEWEDYQIEIAANSKTEDGIVTAGGSNAWMVWQTDANGNPRWRDPGYQIRGRIQIPANSNLNTYVAPGDYYVGLNTTASTITNSPIADTAFRLRVEESTLGPTYIRQTWFPYNGNSLWVRISTDSGANWGAWVNYAANTWQANTKTANGYVPYGNGHNSQVWATSSDGTPSWRSSALYHNTRTTSANDKHSSITDERVTAFLATSSMTTGKPPQDAHVLHFNWDNGTATTGTWDAQMAIRSNNPPKLWIRGEGGGTWSDWLDVSHVPSPTVQTVSVAASGISLNTWQNIATLTLASDGRAKLIIASLSWAGSASARYVTNFSADAQQVEAAHNSTAWSAHHVMATTRTGTLYLRLYSTATPTSAVSGRVTIISL